MEKCPHCSEFIPPEDPTLFQKLDTLSTNDKRCPHCDFELSSSSQSQQLEPMMPLLDADLDTPPEIDLRDSTPLAQVSQISEVFENSSNPPPLPNDEFLEIKNECFNQNASFLNRFFHQFWNTLTHPKAFFSVLPSTGGLAEPLAFALLIHWVGKFLEYLWKSSWFSSYIKNRIDNNWIIDDFGSVSMTWNLLENWFQSFGSVLADPLKMLFHIFFFSFFIFIGAKIIIPENRQKKTPVIFEPIFRIICYSSAGAFFLCTPYIGNFLAALYGFFLSIIGFQKVYGISSARAISITIFPVLFFYLSILVSLSLIVITVLRLMLLF